MKFKCNQCDKSYDNKSSFSVHIHRKHPQYKHINVNGEHIIYSCKCGYTAAKAQSLIAHHRHCLIYRDGVPPVPPGNKGKPSKFRGMKLEQIYGIDRATEIKGKTAKSLSGQKRGSMSEEVKYKLSLARIKYLESVSNRGALWYKVEHLTVQGTWERDIAKKLLTSGITVTRPPN